MKLSIEKRKGFAGLIFCAPFIIGFFAFFLVPLIQSIRYSFSAIKLSEEGISLRFVGLSNFKEALFADPEYIRTITESVRDLLIQGPSILVFSLFIALILNQKFRGRVFMRAVFFLPVIVISGVILEILQADYLSEAIMQGESAGQGMGGSSMLSSDVDLLSQIGLPAAFSKVMTPVLANVSQMVWSSGVQILLFLAGLQTVPPALYESAKIEGATAWEIFWKITFPIISPMLLLNIIYTVVDYFTTSLNPVIKMIASQSANMRFEYAAGLSWMYLIVVLILLGIIYKIINRRIVYM